MNNRPIELNSKCLICNKRKKKDTTKTCGSNICLSLFFWGYHKKDSKRDSSLIDYVLKGDGKSKEFLLGLKKTILKRKIKHLRVDCKDLYCLHEDKFKELING